MTGFPRHDALLALARRVPSAEVNAIIIMPTWRGHLNDTDAKHGVGKATLEAFALSDYAQQWGCLLRSRELHAMAKAHGKRIVFMPHPNAVPYVEGFNIPPEVEVITKGDMRIQELFCRGTVMITDYSSVACEMAYIYRAVFYYQFDRDRFYREHNWREGYFDHERDGFGPVVTDQSTLLEQLGRLLSKGCVPDAEYLARMEQFFAYRDGHVCERVFEAIQALGRPVPNKSKGGDVSLSF